MQAANNAAAKQDVKVVSPPADVAAMVTSSVESDGVPPLPPHKITEVNFPETPAGQMLISKRSPDGTACETLVSSCAAVIPQGSGCPAGQDTVRKAIQMPALTPTRYNFAHLSTLTSSPTCPPRVKDFCRVILVTASRACPPTPCICIPLHPTPCICIAKMKPERGEYPYRPGLAHKTLETASAPLAITACTPIARSNPDAHSTAPPSQLLLTPVAAAAPRFAVSAGETAAAVTAAAEPLGGGFGSPVEAKEHDSRTCRTSLDSETSVESRAPLVTEGGAHSVGESVPKRSIISTSTAIVGTNTGAGCIASPPSRSGVDGADLVEASTVMEALADVMVQEPVRAGGCVITEIGIKRPAPGKEGLVSATGGGDGMSGGSLAAEAVVAALSAEGSTHLNQRAGLLLAVAQVCSHPPLISKE